MQSLVTPPHVLPALQLRVGPPDDDGRKSGQHAPEAVAPGVTVPGQLDAMATPLQTIAVHGVGGGLQPPCTGPHVLFRRQTRVGEPRRPFRQKNRPTPPVAAGVSRWPAATYSAPKPRRPWISSRRGRIGRCSGKPAAAIRLR